MDLELSTAQRTTPRLPAKSKPRSKQCACAPALQTLTGQQAVDELARRRSEGHQSGCQCCSRPGPGCPELRRIALEAGLWARIQ